MDDASPALGVGFEIDAAAAFGTIDRLEDGMDAATNAIVADAKRVEQATGGMVNLGGATAEVNTFGNATTKAMRETVRETARAEKAGEGMVRALGRQATEFGKTRSEIRTMNAELRAVEAESRGLTELAGRIRAVSAEMNRLEASSVNVGQSTNKAGAGLRIIAMQMPDVIQGLLTGQKPMQVLIQQGGQVYQAGQSAGIGLRAMGASLAALLIPFAPVIAAIGVATAGFALFNREINRGVSNDELTRGLGKTAEQAEVAEKQLKKLREETITWGDTASALFTVVGNDIKNSFVKDMTDMGSDVKSVLDDMTTYGKAALAGLYAGTVGMKAYLGEVSKPGAIAKLLTGDDPALFNRTVGASFNKAYDWLGKLGERVRAEAKKNARIRIGEEYGLPDKPKKDSHADQLAREAEAMERQIDNLYKLANAYGVSGAAALIAEARVKAESAAIKKRADVEAAVDRQIRLSIAERVKAGAQSAAAMRDEAMVQASVNSAVRDGSVAARDAQQVMRDRMADLPLLAAMEAAHTLKGKEGVRAVEEAEKALDAQRKAQSDLNAERTRGQLIQMNQSNDRQLAVLREELRLVGATEAVRARSLARVRAEQEVGSTPGADAAKYIEDMVAIADTQAQILLQTQATNDALAHQGVMFDTIAVNAADAARGMSDAFGEAGRALGDMGAIFAGHIADQQRLTAARDAELKALVGLDDQKLKAQRTAQINDLFALRSSAAQIGMYGDMTAAAKGFFDEKSKGYAVLSIAEKAFRAVEFAMSVKAMAQDAIETGSKIASTVARTAVRATEAVVNAIASLPFPANIAAGTATAGALAALGVSVVSSFDGSSRDKLQKANDGSGSVLGDSKAQSESIKRSIDQLREVDTLTNAFAGEMAASLRSIDNQIGGVASAIVRGGDINASAGVNEGFKTNAIGSILKATMPIFGGALASLFGSTTSVIASGLSAQSQTLGSILSGGFDAQTFSDVEKKKKKFLGIVTGKSYSTQYGNADPELEGQFTLLLKSFSSAIGAAAGPLGEATDAVQARLNGFVVSIGKIDLKGLTGEQIQEKLSAVFGKAADDMADAAFPGIARFQQVGEGAFETLVRVASTVEAVTTSLDQLGLASRALGIDAKVGIAAQFDSVSAMTSAGDAYFKAFYTPAEQNAARMSQLNGVFVRLGTTMPATIDAFRALVDAQDLTTAAGQSTYATLLQIAPAFADLKSALDGAKSAADVIAEREVLQRRLLELDGNTAAIRALDLAKLDASNRALQQQIYAIEDAKAAAEAANDLREAWASVGDTIADEVKRIRGLDTVGGGASFATLMGQFNAANLSARGGDIDAAKTLPSLSQALLKVAGEQATSSQELKRIQAQTAATLEATQAAIAGRSAAAATAAILANSANAAAATAPAGIAANDASAATIASLKDEVKGLRDSMEAALATIASNTGRAARVLDDVSAASGGDAISVAAAA